MRTQRTRPSLVSHFLKVVPGSMAIPRLCITANIMRETGTPYSIARLAFADQVE